MSDEREFLRANEIGRRGATSKRVIGKDSNEKIEGISFDDRQVSQQRRTAEGNGQRRKNGEEWKRWGETSEPFTDGRKWIFKRTVDEHKGSDDSVSRMSW